MYIQKSYEMAILNEQQIEEKSKEFQKKNGGANSE
jgi:hypothetical protein